MTSSTSLDIVDLYERPVDIPLVAEWIFRAFWSDQGVVTREWLVEQLSRAANPEQLPLSLLALIGGRPIGTINLIENDDEKRPHLRPWLAALFVLPKYRGRGIGSQLVRVLQRRAAEMNIERLYLGTDNPGFYSRLGATVHEQVSSDFCVMSIATRAE